MIRTRTTASRSAALVICIIMAFTCLSSVAFAGNTEKTDSPKNTESGSVSAAIKTKTQECEAAKSKVSKLEDEISNLKDQKNTAHQQVFALPEEIDKVKKTLAEEEEKWKQEKEQAEKEVDEAQSACDAAGRRFINDKINAQSGKDLDTMIETCRTFTSAGIKSATDLNGNSYSTIAGVAKSDNFEKLVNLGCRYENLKKSVAYIREANAHRKLSIHNSEELKVSYQLMGTSIISGAISVYQMGHNLIKGDTNWTFWKSGNSSSSAENLAYSPVSSDEGWDPFHSWYYDERIVVIAENRGSGVKQSIIDGVLAESANNGYPYSPYKAPWNQSKSYYLGNIDHQTGHYKALLNNKYKATGFSHIDGDDYRTSKYCHVAVQEFNNDTSTAVSVDEYEKEMDAWFEPYVKPLEEAKSKLEALQKEPEEVTKAKSDIKSREEALDKAKKSVEDTAALIETGEDDVEKAKADLEKKQKELKKLAEEHNKGKGVKK